MFSWLTAWHLTVILAGLIIWREKSQRREIIYGGLVSLSVLLLVPIISSSYFGLFTTTEILTFFVSQAIVVFALGVIVSELYEKVLRVKIVKIPKSSRHHFLFFSVGLILSLLMFDVFGQPLLPSLIYGIGINFLLAIRYYYDHIYDIVFASLVMGGFFVFIYVAVLFDLPGDAGNFWFSDTLSGLTLIGLAVEKIATVFVYGLFWGPLYVGLKDVFARKD